MSKLEPIAAELKAFLADLIDEDELDARLIERLSDPLRERKAGRKFTMRISN